MKNNCLLKGGLLAMAFQFSAWGAEIDWLSRASAFIQKHEAVIRPLEKQANLAWWDANITGKDEDFKKKEESQNKIDAILSDRKSFSEIEAIKKDGQVADKLLKRQIDLVYLAYLEKQVDPSLLKKIVAKANSVEKAFNVFRAKVEGQELTENQVRKTLKEVRDSSQLQKTWEASKEVGSIVEKELKELVELRNQAARKLGFPHYHEMMLVLQEQSGQSVLKLFDELDSLTQEPFKAAKSDIDKRLAKALGIKVDELRPWHYRDPFFQESPSVFEADLDSVYATTDILQLSRNFYSGIGLPIEDVIARSDLYEKKGKSPHAFCTDIDREGDVRVLANLVPNEYWIETLLHELGHAVYSSKNIPKTLPYLLRSESHILTTEGIAMMFGRLSKNIHWMQETGIAPKKAVARKKIGQAASQILRNQLLVFSRWCQVMLRFERAMYENPAQDLNKRWWDLVERYQLIKRPELRNKPDYASKIHLVSAPVYYHNYMMGELFASQLHHAITSKLFSKQKPSRVTYVGDKRVGDYLKTQVFGPGRTLGWNELTRYSTGEELNARAFAEDFSERLK
ncbi:MAG: M3 family oligoendopeptidase [Deltaproteobacteria bacterium]|nr:M3 family oligoendopeptidase [Deltaproteobacteria bacterium]